MTRRPRHLWPLVMLASLIVVMGLTITDWQELSLAVLVAFAGFGLALLTEGRGWEPRSARNLLLVAAVYLIVGGLAAMDDPMYAILGGFAALWPLIAAVHVSPEPALGLAGERAVHTRPLSPG